MTVLDLSPVEASWHALLSQLPTCGLTALRDGLERDDTAILQKAAVLPSPVGISGLSSPCAACAIGYALWKAWRLSVAYAVDREFGMSVSRAQYASGDFKGIIAALEWYDEAPRAVAFALVLKVARLVLAQRAKAEVA